MAANPETATVPLRTVVARAPFDEWGYREADAALKALHSDARDQRPVRGGERAATYARPSYEIRRAYAVLRDAWQAGGEWVGPGEVARNDRIADQFAPDDAIGEALDNVGNAFGEPQVSVLPVVEPEEGQELPPAVQAKIKEAEAALYEWWDRQRAQERVMDRVRTAAWAGRAALRLWVPGRFLEREGEDGVRFLPTRDAATALRYIHLAAPEPIACGVVTDEATQERCAVFLDDEEITDANGAKRTVKRAELVYIDPAAGVGDEPNTVLRVVYEEAGRAGYTVPLPLGGRLLTAEMETPMLVTDPVIRTQRQLSFLCSLLTRMAETAAFRERYIMNAKPVGKRTAWEDGDDVPEGAYVERDETGALWVVQATERTLGSNTTTELVGLDRRDKDGNVSGQESPTVQVFDPVDPTPYVEAAERVRGRILRMCKQGHLAGTSEARLSGVAYEQARAAFGKDLNRRRFAEEGMLRDVLTAALHLAEYIAGKPGYFTEVVRVSVDQHVDPGPRSPESVRVDMEAADASLLSRQTAMARMGVEDPVAEEQRIEDEAEGALPRWQQVGEVLKNLLPLEAISTETAVQMLQDAGLPIEDAAAEVQRIRDAQAPPPGFPGSGLGNEGREIPIPGLTGGAT